MGGGLVGGVPITPAVDLPTGPGVTRSGISNGVSCGLGGRVGDPGGVPAQLEMTWLGEVNGFSTGLWNSLRREEEVRVEEAARMVGGKEKAWEVVVGDEVVDGTRGRPPVYARGVRSCRGISLLVVGVHNGEEGKDEEWEWEVYTGVRGVSGGEEKRSPPPCCGLDAGRLLLVPMDERRIEGKKRRSRRRGGGWRKSCGLLLLMEWLVWLRIIGELLGGEIRRVGEELSFGLLPLLVGQRGPKRRKRRRREWECECRPW